jgi:segregation and condensation protein A
MSGTFVINTTAFEGPLDLLLELVTERKLFINDVSLSEVAEAYLSYVHEHEASIRELTEFLGVAATLLLIKSRSLLPNISLSDEEESAIGELETRLANKKILSEFTALLANTFGNCVLCHTTCTKEHSITFRPGDDLHQEALQQAAVMLCSSLPQPTKRHEARVQATVRLDEVIKELRERMTHELRLSFARLSATANSTDAATIIVNFLAVLELAKQGILRLEQSESFGDIELASEYVATPTYG